MNQLIGLIAGIVLEDGWGDFPLLNRCDKIIGAAATAQVLHDELSLREGTESADFREYLRCNVSIVESIKANAWKFDPELGSSPGTERAV